MALQVEHQAGEEQNPVASCDPTAATGEDAGETVLQEAQRLISGEKRSEYGSPLQSFQTIAELWATILRAPVTQEQVALCMIGFKIAREMNAHKRDNLVDIAGYAGALDMVIREKEEGAMQDKIDIPIKHIATEHAPVAVPVETEPEPIWHARSKARCLYQMAASYHYWKDKMDAPYICGAQTEQSIEEWARANISIPGVGDILASVP